MNQLTHLKSIGFSIFFLALFFCTCKKSAESAYPVFKDQELERINQQLIAFDSLIYREESDSLVNFGGPIIADIIKDLEQRKKPAKYCYLLAKAYRINGACMEWENEYDQALKEYLKARDLFKKYGAKNDFDAREEADILNYLGVYYQNVYIDPELSNAYFLQSNALNEGLNRPIELVRNWVNLANNAMTAQKLKLSKQYLNKAAHIYQQIPPKEEYKIDYYGTLNFLGTYHKYMADSLSYIGQETLAKTHCDSAFIHYEQTLQGLAQLKKLDPSLLNKKLAVYLNYLSLLIRHEHYYVNPQDSISKYIQKARDLVPVESRPNFDKKFAWPIAYVTALEGNEQKAAAIIEAVHQWNLQEGLYERALINPVSLENAYNILITRNRIYGMLAKKTRAPKDWLKGIQACQENLNYVADIRKRLVAGASQELVSIDFLARIESGLNYVYQYWKQNRNENSLDLGIELLVKSKAQILEQQLQKARFLNFRNAQSKATPAYQEYALQRAMQKAVGQNDQQLFEEKREQYRFFKDTLSKSEHPLSKKYYLERFADNVPSIQQIRQLLPNNQVAVIDYQSTYNYAFALVITKKSAHLVPLPIDAEFYTLGNDYRRHLKGNSRGIYEPSISLHQYLIAPIDSILQAEQIKELILVPDKFIANLAFESLVYNRSKTAPKFLLEKYHISYHYSLAAWSVQQQLGNLKNKASKALGSFVAVPKTDGAYQEACAAIALPELVKMSKDLKQKIGKGECYEDVNRQTFLSLHHQYNIIQLIMHGCIDEENGKQPYLVFAPGNSSKDRLWMQDIYELSFNARLVVLASCLTAQGEALTNEGAKSIARAFLFGGCPRVIAGINYIPDRSGAKILNYFYNYLQQGKPPHRALTEAKRRFVAPAKDKHPSNWAGLVFFGDTGWN